MRSFGTLLVAGLAGSAIAAPIGAGPTLIDNNATFQVAKRAPLSDEADAIAHIMRDIGSIDPDQIISALHRRSQDGLELDVEELVARTPGGALSKLGKGKGKDKSGGSETKDDDNNDDKFFSKDRPIADPHSYDSYNDLGGHKPAKRGGAFSKLGKGKGKDKSSGSESKDDDSNDDKFFNKEAPIADPHSYDSYNDLGGHKPAKRGGSLSKLGNKGKGKGKDDSSSKDDDSKDDKFFSKDKPIADPHSYDSYNDLGGHKPAKRGGSLSKLGNGKGKGKDDSGSKDDDSKDDKFFSKDRPIADPHSYDSYNDLGGNKPAKRTPGGAFSKIGKGKGKGKDDSSSKDDDINDDKFFSKDRPIADPHSYDSYNDLGGHKPAKRGGAFSKLGKGKDKSSSSSSSKDDDNDDKFFSKEAPIADPHSYDSYNDLGGHKPAKRSFWSA